MATPLPEPVGRAMRRGLVIPAMPLALDARRRLDERRQRGLIRYYAAAGAGGLAVGVHTTQFAIREPRHGLFEPLLTLAREELDRADLSRATPMIRIGGVCGGTRQAVEEAGILKERGYHAALLSLAALAKEADAARLAHCRAVAEVIPLVGFYLQAAVGGPVLSEAFWRGFCEVPEAVAIKIAPFNRYQTLDVVRAVAASGRDDLALYTGNDDQIVLDLVTPFVVDVGGRRVRRRIVGGLLGQWAVGTRRAVELLHVCHAAVAAGGDIPRTLLEVAAPLTELNAACFDVAHGFAGCIAGIHEVLRRQGLLEGTWCLEPGEGLSPEQEEAIGRAMHAYPELGDDAFIAEHRAEWLSG